MVERNGELVLGENQPWDADGGRDGQEFYRSA
jgi:hypothetical protein